MTYMVQHRHRTPKGQATVLKTERGLSQEAALATLQNVLPTSCFVYIEDEDASFAGKG